MATGLVKNVSVIGCMEEVTEGTWLAPAAATNYIQPLADGFDLNPSRETIQRNQLTNAIGVSSPRLGVKSVTCALPVEYRASGTEGGDVDYSPLLQSALGGTRSIASQSTTKAGNTATVLQIEDADISKYSVHDIIVVLESGAHEVRPISEVDTTGGAANITLAIPLENGAPADNVVISKSQMHYCADTGHPTLAMSYYWANEILQKAMGCRCTSLSLDSYTTGQLASLNFGMEGLDYDEVDGTAPHTPSYDDEVPPILLNACIYYDQNSIAVNNLTLSLTNTLGAISSMCTDNGRVSTRLVRREITGSIDPPKDDTATTYFDNWDTGTEFSLFAYAANPHASNDGEFDLGSVIGLWLPHCYPTEFQTTDSEGVLIDQLGFQATRGVAGDQVEMWIGFI